MRQLAALLGVAAIAFAAIACNPPASTYEAGVQALKDNEAQWNLDWQSKVADKIAAHYSDDAVLMVPGMTPTVGKDAILGALKQMVADPAITLKFQATKVEVAKSGDLGYTQGSYTLTITDPQTKKPVNDHGSYVTAYRKLPDGSWKAVSDIASSEVPPPAPPPAPAKKH